MRQPWIVLMGLRRLVYVNASEQLVLRSKLGDVVGLCRYVARKYVQALHKNFHEEIAKEAHLQIMLKKQALLQARDRRREERNKRILNVPRPEDWDASQVQLRASFALYPVRLVDAFTGELIGEHMERGYALIDDTIAKLHKFARIAGERMDWLLVDMSLGTKQVKELIVEGQDLTLKIWKTKKGAAPSMNQIREEEEAQG